MLDVNIIRERLVGSTFISSVYHFDEIDSTNNYAKSLKEDNVLVIAEYQSGGKGRFERKWNSQKGKNLTFSIKKNFNISPEKNSHINFYFSYYLYEAIRSYLQAQNADAGTSLLNIKWPNDIMLDSKKISGLLIESLLSKKDYIIGTGLNVNQTKFENAPNASSLINYIKSETDLNTLLVNIIKLFDENLELIYDSRFDEIYELWKKSTNMIGKDVEFIINNAINCGKIIGLLDDGAIRIMTDNKEKTYRSGEIKIQTRRS
jgi:BirA family biotin operon repressor/biotin-[acetyl-CoA-carboxylase] ligase